MYRTAQLFLSLILSAAPLFAQSDFESRLVNTAYFIANTSPAGKKVVDNQSVTAFQQGSKGRILFTADGAYVGMTTTDNTRAKKGGEASPAAVVLKTGFGSTGQKRAAGPRLVDQTNHYVNFLAKDPAASITGVKTYQSLVYDQVWPGIDMSFNARPDRLSYQLQLEPGANPAAIVMETGAEDLQLTLAGGLRAALAGVGLNLTPPRAYQVVDGKRLERTVRYRPMSGGRYGFEVDSYDRSRALTISPSLDWSTLFGGGGHWQGEFATNVVLNADGLIVVAGSSSVADFPTTAGAQTQWVGGYDLFVTGISPDLTGISFSTFVGGLGDERPKSLRIDPDGNLVLVGTTDSEDFPTTPNAWRQSPMGWEDIFLVKLDATGSNLIYSTYFGGAYVDEANDLLIDQDGFMYLLGTTRSFDYPNTVPAKAAKAGVDTDLALTKFSPDGSEIVFSHVTLNNQNEHAQAMAFLPDGDVAIGADMAPPDPLKAGGAKAENKRYHGYQPLLYRMKPDGTQVYRKVLGWGYLFSVYGIDVGPAGNLYLLGEADDRNEATPGSYGPENAGSDDAFVLKLNGDNAEVLYATFLGGAQRETPRQILVHDNGSVSVLGTTSSDNFPTSPGAYQTERHGFTCTFLSRLSPDGSELEMSTLLAGQQYIEASAMVLDAAGRYVLVGTTDSKDFPTTDGVISSQINGGNDAFISIFTTDGTQLHASTLLGGGGVDGLAAMARDEAGNVFLGGSTTTAAFPTTPGTFEPPGFVYDAAYVTKFNSAGTGLHYSTYFGGYGADFVTGIAVDASGLAVVSGNTWSSDFPTTPGAYDTTYGASGDHFVAKLDQDGRSFVFSTFVGRGNSDVTTGIAVDESNEIYVCGYTKSSNFPTTPGAYQETKPHLGDTYAGIFYKLAADGASLVFSTFLGGSGDDFITALALDGAGTPFVLGSTSSGDFPYTPGAFNGPDPDIFVTKFQPDGSDLIYSALIGDTSGFSRDLAVSSGGEAVVVGATFDPEFPITPGGNDTGLEYGAAFVSRLNSTGSDLIFSTLLGGSQREEARSVSINRKGDVIVTGDTESGDFPVTTDAFDPTYADGEDGFMVILDHFGQFLYGTYLGGSADESIYHSAIDQNGGILLAGQTRSNEFPTTTGAWREDRFGFRDIFLTRFNICPQPRFHASAGALGLEDPVFRLLGGCEDGEGELIWSCDPPTDMDVDGYQMTLTSPPSETTMVTLTLDDELLGQHVFSSILLIAPGYSDYNGDSCSNIQDLWDFGLWWGSAFAGDPNGDGWVDIRDLLYLNAAEATACP